MDQSPLVEAQVADGRRFVERFAADGNPVRAAFWVKTAEEGHWFLYVATAVVDDAGPAAAYRAVRASLQTLGPSWLTGSEIKVIGAGNPLAEDVLALMARHPRRIGSLMGDTTLGRVSVDQVYVYPAVFFTFGQGPAMTTEDVGFELVRLLNRGPGLRQPSRVTMKDGTQFNGVPFGIQLGSHNAAVAQFIADGEAAPRVIRLDEIASLA